MKYLKYLFIFLCSISFFAFGCNKFEDSTTEDSVTYKLDKRSGGEDLYVFYDSLGLFWDDSDSIIYFLRYTDVPTHTLSEDISVEYYNDDDVNAKLVVKSRHSYGVVLDTFAFSQDIFGIGFLTGNGNTELYMEEESGFFYFPTQPDIQEVACDCFANGTTPPSNCQHGGSSTSGCAAGESMLGISKNCEVRCKGTHYACCNDHDVSWHWD